MRLAHSVKTRFDVLDLQRAIGFLLVLLSHASGFAGNPLGTDIGSLGAVLMAYFFLLSGFVAGHSADDRLRAGALTPMRFLARRAVRYWPMLALGTLLGALPLAVRLVYWGDSYGVAPALKGFIMGCILVPMTTQPFWRLHYSEAFLFDPPAWFLFYDLLALAAYAMVLRRLSLQWLVGIAVLAGAGLSAAAISHNTVNYGDWWPSFLLAGPYALYSFVLGYALFRLRDLFRGELPEVWAFILVAGLLAISLAPVPLHWRFSGALQAFIVIAVLPLLMWLSLRVKTGPRLHGVAQTAARFAYPIYILHYPVVRTASELIPRLHIHGAWLAALMMAEMAAALGVAVLAAIFIDEPLRRLLSRKLGLAPARQADGALDFAARSRAPAR
jgi:peptidoglycan/LPS O-acetylase OafA/YrhL